jgi:hypothetical protein
MNSGTLTANDLGLVAAALNTIANTLGVADVNNSLTNALTSITTAKDSAIADFNSSANGTRLTTAEGKITTLQSQMTNVQGFVSTNGTQYTTLQSTVSALQTSISNVPSSWITKTTSYTAVNGDRIMVLAGGITITLPTNPGLGYTVEIVDALGTAGTTPFTIARNSQNIQRLAQDLTVNLSGASVRLVFVDATRGWVKA